MKKAKKYTTGFTLIELLVAIAVIGVLSAVVLSNLKSSRTTAADKTTISSLLNLQVQAEYYYDNVGVKSYCMPGGGCEANALSLCQGRNMFRDIPIQNAIIAALAPQGGGTAKCISSSQAYAVAIPLKLGMAWCVDSARKSKVITGTAQLTTASCP